MNADNDKLVAGSLAGNDAACPSCGYELRGLTRARCPECGMPLDVELLRDGPYEGPDIWRDVIDSLPLDGWRMPLAHGRG